VDANENDFGKLWFIRNFNAVNAVAGAAALRQFLL
jgi:hypothetical protein